MVHTGSDGVRMIDDQGDLPLRSCGAGPRMHAEDARGTREGRRKRTRPPETLGECFPGEFVVTADGERLIVGSHIAGSVFCRPADGGELHPRARDTRVQLEDG